MEINIIPLFILIEEKLEGLKEFFFDTDRRINIEIDGESGSKGVGSQDSNWEQLKENWLEKRVRTEGKKIRHINYHHELKGFKKTVSGHSFGLSMEVFFNDYNYSIQTNSNRNQPLQIPYGKKLNITELQNIITPIMKVIIEDIKRLNGNN